MKKLLICLISLVLLFSLSPICYAVEGTNNNVDYIFDLDEIYNNLFDELDEDTIDILNQIGVTPDILNSKDINFYDLIEILKKIFIKNLSAPLGGFATITGIILIFAIFDVFRDGATSTTMQNTLQILIVLAITFILVIPITDFITQTINTINTSTKFMLIYIPIICTIMAASGNILTSGSYYGLMMFACGGMSQLCTDVIAPILNIFFGVSITSAICPTFKLGGICKIINNIIKWLLGFSMSIFSAMLTFKTIINTMTDSVSTRAIRFSISSFIPIVGSSLSEAYKTIHSSINILKSGVGVFSIIAVIIVFLPIIIKGLLWILSINLCKGVAQILSSNISCEVLEISATVITTTLVIVACVIALFIISTSILILSGGGAN